MADGPRRHGFPVCREPHLNTLSSVWYCTAGLALSIYVIAGSVQRFTRYMSLPWPSRDQPYIELNAYVACIGAGVVLLPFFVASAVLQVGNMSNDAATVGGEVDEATPAPDPSALYENLPRRARRKPGMCGGALKRWLKAAWRHGGPTAPTLHLWSAFCLLVPKAIMHARLIRHGFLKRSDVWHTDMDFLIPHRERLVPIHFLPTVNETELWERDTQEPSRPAINHLDVTGHISAEFINYALALFIYSLRYPAVFWKRNKCFSLFFSLYLVFTMVCLKLLVFTSVGILHGVHIVGQRDLLHRFAPFILNVPSTLGLYFIYTVLVTVSGSLVYSYGLLKYSEWKSRTALKHHITWQGAQAGGITFYGHGPHIYSLLVLVSMVLVGAPIVHDLVKIYQASLDGVVLVTICGIVGHIAIWILMWLLFTVKHEWDFCAENGPLSEHPMNFSTSARATGQNQYSYTPLLKIADGPDHPLLVVDNGQTYRVSEISSKKAILGLASRQQQVQKLPHPSEDEDIYWLKPRMPIKEGDQPNSLSWLRSQKPKNYQGQPLINGQAPTGPQGPPASGPPSKPKVTFDTSNSPSKTRSAGKSPKKLKKPPAKLPEELNHGNEMSPLKNSSSLHRETSSQFYKSLCPLSDENEANGVLLAQNGEFDPLTIDTQNPQLRGILTQQNGGTLSPATLTPRSDCVSDTSTSPEKGGSSNDSNSSGVHSACSDQLKRTNSLEQLLVEVQNQIPLPPTATIHQRSGSVQHNWKSMSLQRTTMGGVNGITHNGYGDGTNSLVIRRNASNVCDMQARRPPMRLTSFTEQPDFTVGPTRILPPTVPSLPSMPNFSKPPAMPPLPQSGLQLSDNSDWNQRAPAAAQQ
ncbi:uncharacterized protein LOC111268357 isoform X1 [Varroa jacobsoni]|uniref:uncharacterized protein LOC111268357 isoform X1 n=1 Tax=Varroa jacobsoni TaxID=62625 RepID=UPI000BF75EAF|nr:uncharacterized protein LOC111268357 isoform X1 [Varroa jacobsoni]